MERAARQGRTIYTKNVVPPGISHVNKKPTSLLKRASSNNKLGKRAGATWSKGPFKGMPLYSLTLEERATCDSECPVWTICYGNNMPFATRFDASIYQDLVNMLAAELTLLDVRHKQGYSIRLHVLGDFFSVEYVQFWGEMLDKHPLLHIFGYTHRTGEIKEAIEDVFYTNPHRFVILQSDGFSELRPSALIAGMTPGAERLPICPEQLGKVNGCLDCGLCTSPHIKGVAFLAH